MLSLNLLSGGKSPLNVLCLGAHSDDIEIGCGGTILRLAERDPSCTFQWEVFSAIGVREAEAHQAARLFTDSADLREPVIRAFPDGFLPFAGAEVKKIFEELKQKVSPDIIFTPRRKDAHQDHRLIGELTWNTFRNHLILEYEIPKYDGDMAQPNVFVPLDAGMCERKIKYIMNAFPSQHSKRWFEDSTFRSLLRLRGMECNADSGYAEAFYCSKLVL